MNINLNLRRLTPLLLMMLATNPVGAVPSSEVSLVASGFFDPVSAGGDNIGSVFVNDAGSQVATDHWRSVYAESNAAADSGELSLGIFGSVWTGDTTATNGGGGGLARAFDEFSIGPGTSGLGDGAFVQVLVQVRLEGAVRLAGRARPDKYSLAQLSLSTTAGSLLAYTTGNLLPPVELSVDESWDFVADTSIGQTFSVDITLSGGVDGSAFDRFESGRNYLDMDAAFRVTAALGFESIEIVSASGAPTTPVPTADDFDGDGITDVVDNCTGIYNPVQLDSNGDNLGNACDPDIDATPDCAVSFPDLAAIKQAFFSEPGLPNWNADADFNGDGVVSFQDLGVMKQFFFGPPGPSLLPNDCSPVPHGAGTLDLHPGMALDLDTGLETTVDDPAADVAWTAGTDPEDAFLEPVYGSLLDDFGPDEPIWVDCVLSSPSDEPVPIAVVGVGTYLCAITGEDRIARFRVESSDTVLLREATELGISWSSWE